MSTTTNNEKNMKESCASKLMGILDNHKEGVPDGLYLELCNALAEMNTEEKKEETGFYKVTYLYSKAKRLEENFHRMEIHSSKEIIRISHETAERVTETIECDGHCKQLSDFRELAHFLECNSVHVEDAHSGEDCDDATVMFQSHAQIVRLEKLQIIK